MALLIERLSKRYGNGIQALRDVSITIGRGMFGLLGPNGAGKSTLMRTIATLQAPDSGTIRLDGIDAGAEPDRLRALLGYLPQEFGLYPRMSAEATLDHFATLHGVVEPVARRERVVALLQQMNLLDARRQHVGSFSGGMRQRLGIAIALAGAPRLLIVDEPTAGLDPSERSRLLDLLADVAERAVVILSTHIVEDVQDVCSQVAIMSGGQIVLTGAPDSLTRSLLGSVWEGAVPRADADAIRSRSTVIGSRRVRGLVALRVYSKVAMDSPFVSAQPCLEDVYMRTVATA